MSKDDYPKSFSVVDAFDNVSPFNFKTSYFRFL
jgi:hypothetical protein